ncbi:2,3-bisphosphoglycerate-independent phosphoglycerate mutase [Monoraphidium neglectum]|uniref:2,3-bisphosphoglycerate-independent phosphoglycerate mutase n=1 Tax=Monoraphidium neglectum TaxID=145388 RepID=A0A0D2NIK9_9CHLO|nr:2,3-bisphosphoglycerate-independent phosphoglycerate mutase [Monoraphidium neglectum]KIZ04761.1 2,3-bisphosphoglycerate-independent phosphoglycerate mutase [Monoraphidium neglectum]|eukprot:XP_013903780.1 2,3-bisphosphoglycerate-independent phosphoglycerate mutase [Monoraphidium neglectum]
MVKRGWDAHVLGEAPNKFTSAVEAVKKLRGSPEDPISDQYLPAFVIVDEKGEPVRAQRSVPWGARHGGTGGGGFSTHMLRLKRSG